METTVSRVSRLLGAELGPDAFQAIRRSPRAIVEGFAEGYLAEPLLPGADESAAELWPVVDARSASLVSGYGAHRELIVTPSSSTVAVNPLAATDPRLLGTGRFSGSVVRALLYCHGLVIEDPVGIACDIYLNTPADERELVRPVIEIALASAGEIAPLIDDGIVHTWFADREGEPGRVRRQLVDHLAGRALALDKDAIWDVFEQAYAEGLDPALRPLWLAIRDGDADIPLHLVRDATKNAGHAATERFLNVVEHLDESDAVNNVLDMLAMAIVIDRQLGGRFDLHLPGTAHAAVASELLGGVDGIRLDQLARTEVPSLDDIGMADLVAIRRHSDAFDHWRRHLAIALDHAHLMADDLRDESDAARVVADSLAAGRAAVLGEVQGSKRLSGIGRRVVALVAGVFGGAVGGALGGPGGAALGAAGGATPALAEAIASRAGGPPGWLRRHWLAFERPPSDTA